MNQQQESDYSSIKYQILAIQYIQGKWKISKQFMKEGKILFANITNQGIQLRTIQKSTISQIVTLQQLEYSQILKNSMIQDLIEFENLIRVDKKIYTQRRDCIIGIYSSKKQCADKNKPLLVLRLKSEANMDECFDQINDKLKQQRDYLKKSTINYIGIEQNIRKIIQKILITSPGKREVYYRIEKKLKQKNIFLSVQHNKMMMYALMGNNPDMQNLIRKTKIEAYDIEKRRYDEQLKQENLNSMMDASQMNNPRLILQGYSEKRKMDGIIVKRRAQKEEKDALNNRNFQQLYIQKVPYRQQYEVDDLIGIQNKVQNMEIEKKVRPQMPIAYKAQKIQIPAKDYSLVSKQVEWVRKQQNTLFEGLDNTLIIAIQAVKFMYQLMKANSRERRKYQLIQGPMDGVLDCLKDILTQCEYKQDERKMEKKQIQNKSVMELLNKASKNYLQYRKNPNKFY